MKVLLILIPMLCIYTTCAQVALAAVVPIEVHVAPTGDDAGDGSRANPVASLSGARDAVRRLRAEGKAGPVRVVVADVMGNRRRLATPGGMAPLNLTPMPQYLLGASVVRPAP